MWSCIVKSSYQVFWQGIKSINNKCFFDIYNNKVLFIEVLLGDWAMGCDFRVGQALRDIRVSADWCGPSCVSTPGCTHFAWNNYNGGTCWMKKGGASKSDAFAANPSMVCGVVSR